VSYVQDAIDLGVTTLANSAAFRTLVGAANPTAALSKIVKTHSGAPQDNAGVIGDGVAADGSTLSLDTAPWALVGCDGINTAPGGIGYWEREGAVVIKLVQTRRIDPETPPAATSRAWTVAGDIASEIEAQVGTSTGFADADVSLTGLFMDDEGASRNHIIVELTINFRG
jgi:hypothetical protein